MRDKDESKIKPRFLTRMKRNAIFFFFTIEDAEREGAGVGG